MISKAQICCVETFSNLSLSLYQARYLLFPSCHDCIAPSLRSIRARVPILDVLLRGGPFMSREALWEATEEDASMPPFQRSEKVLHNFVQGRNKGLCVSLSRTKAEILLPNMRCIKGELISPFLNLTFLSRNRYANFQSLSTTHSGFIMNSDEISTISIVDVL